MDNPKIPQCTSLPAYARHPINHCNLPAVIIGSLAFQEHPSALSLDGVETLHHQLFDALAEIDDAATRALHFRDYMCSCFLLDHKDEAGFQPTQRLPRGKADYLRLLRGWMFNADGVEAAVFKRWVESRFGLRARSHRGPLGDYENHNYERYQADYMRGLYNANALESQLDLLYSFCQYELQRREPNRSHWQLFRGVNKIEEHDILEKINDNHYILLLNNINAFSSDRYQSDTFGDAILTAEIPLSKIVYFPNLIPGILQGESEFLVLGGVFRVKVGW